MVLFSTRDWITYKSRSWCLYCLPNPVPIVAPIVVPIVVVIVPSTMKVSDQHQQNRSQSLPASGYPRASSGCSANVFSLVAILKSCYGYRACGRLAATVYPGDANNLVRTSFLTSCVSIIGAADASKVASGSTRQMTERRFILGR
jgi:hypothetical protein